MPRISNRIDLLVGHNIRAYRLAAGMSQEELGRRLGLTFQQIQKYEKGANRVGSGRLYDISSIFGVPIAAFFEGAETVKLAGPKRSGSLSSPFELISEPHAFRLLQAFSRLEHRALRLSVVSLVEEMANAVPASKSG